MISLREVGTQKVSMQKVYSTTQLSPTKRQKTAAYKLDGGQRVQRQYVNFISFLIWKKKKIVWFLDFGSMERLIDAKNLFCQFKPLDNIIYPLESQNSNKVFILKNKEIQT